MTFVILFLFNFIYVVFGVYDFVNNTIFIKYLNLIEMKIIIQLNKFIKCTFGYTNIDLIYLYF